MSQAFTTVAILYATFFVSSTSGQLFLHAAGPITENSIIRQIPAETVTTICPHNFPTGFTILCHDHTVDMTKVHHVRKVRSGAKFFVNGVNVHVDHTTPIFLAGKNENATASHSWIASIGSFFVECRLSDQNYKSRVEISCEENRQSSSEKASKLDLDPAKKMILGGTCAASSCVISNVESGSIENENLKMFAVPADIPSNENLFKVALTRRMTICPPRDLGTSSFSIECGPSLDATQARFRLILLNESTVWKRRGTPIRRDFKPPFTITSEIDGILKPFEPPSSAFLIRCSLNDGRRVVSRLSVRCDSVNTTPEFSMLAEYSAESNDQGDASTEPNEDPRGCIVLDTSTLQMIPPDWKVLHDGVGFRMDDPTKAITRKGVSVLKFTFRAKLDGRHALVLDLTTSHKSDHNDLWIRFSPGGIALRKADHMDKNFSENDWIKVYQKLNGRGASIASGDHDPHSVTTALSLQKGKYYTLSISGRSSKVILHRAIIFPCDLNNENKCLRWLWRTLQNDCLPGSFPR